MNFITIRSSHNEMDLHLLKSKLESEGITCFLKNEYTTQVMNYMATFEVELQVPEEDVERALLIMKEMDKK